MDAAENLLRFADECEQMAKRTSDREGKHAWRELAQRWRRCAELRQEQDASRESAVYRAQQAKLHPLPAAG
jgi:hypothetical protein